MRIFSQNLMNYNIPIPEGSIFRINLAWINTLDELKTILKKYEYSKIFMDLPIGRTKPPNNKYSFDDLMPILLIKIFNILQFQMLIHHKILIFLLIRFQNM